MITWDYLSFYENFFILILITFYNWGWVLPLIELTPHPPTDLTLGSGIFFNLVCLPWMSELGIRKSIRPCKTLPQIIMSNQAELNLLCVRLNLILPQQKHVGLYVWFCYQHCGHFIVVSSFKNKKEDSLHLFKALKYIDLNFCFANLLKLW